MNSLLPGIFLFTVTFIGGLIAYFVQFRFNQAVKLFLSFSGAFLLATCVMHLLPELFEDGNSFAPFILLGFLMQILIEYISQGVEHGHIHPTDDLRGFPLLIFAGLSVHAFIEGLPLLKIEWNSISQSPLYWSILLHKLPISIVLVSLLAAYKVKPKIALLALLFFAALTPVAGLLGSRIAGDHDSDLVKYFLAASTGIFLHISTVIIFETSSNHRFNYLKLIFIIFGGLLSVVIF